jgi:hypothetical protein
MSNTWNICLSCVHEDIQHIKGDSDPQYSYTLEEQTLLEIMLLFYLYSEEKTRELLTPVRIYCAR